MAGQKRVLLLCGDYVEDYEVDIFFPGYCYSNCSTKPLCEVSLNELVDDCFFR